MSTRYGDRDNERGQRDYGRRSESEYDRSYGERSQRRYEFDRDENERDRFGRESSSGRYSSGRYSGRDYGRGSQDRSRGEYRGREGYRPGSENDWDYTDDRESRYGSFARGYDTGSYDDISRYDTRSGSSSSRYNYPSGYRSGETYGERGRDYDYDYERRGWLDRLADKLSAWFGDEDAERRYRMDEQRDRPRGKGPKSYRRSDERIREDVNDQLSEGYLDASEVEVMVVDGVVTLNGTVNSRSDKRRAEDIADDVRGVKNVENRLRVEQRDIDRYPSLTENRSSFGTTGGTTDSTTTGTTGTTGTARGKTAGT